MSIEEVMPLGSSTPAKKMYRCLNCEKAFSIDFNLSQHIKIHSSEKLYTCDICQKSFGRRPSLQRDLKTHNSVQPLEHDGYSEVFTEKDMYYEALWISVYHLKKFYL